MNASSTRTFDRTRVSTGYFLAAAIGFVSLYLMIVAWGPLSDAIDPTARFAVFVSKLPRHPVRLEVAGLVLPAILGALLGIGLAFLIRWMRIPNYWLVWLLFAAGFIGSISLATRGFDSWPIMGLMRMGAFLSTSAGSLPVAVRWIGRSAGRC
jgi:hypothetical protein